MNLPDEKVLHELLQHHPHLLDPRFLGATCDSRVRLGPRKIADLLIRLSPPSIVELKVVPFSERWATQLREYLELYAARENVRAEGLLVVRADGQSRHLDFVQRMADSGFEVRVLFWGTDVPWGAQLRLCNNCNRAVRYRPESVSCRYCKKSRGFRPLAA